MCKVVPDELDPSRLNSIKVLGLGFLCVGGRAVIVLARHDAI